MAQRQTNMARQARADLAQAQQVRRQTEAQQLTEYLQTDNGRADPLQRLAESFDALEVGDSLAEFGMPSRVVAKKNRKSVVSCGGQRWTRHELTGVK